MSWANNPIMEWSVDNGTTWIKVTDHGRSPLTVGVERIENKQTMVSGTKRRYVVAKKRTFSCSWDNLPDKSTSFLANGTTYGNWIEEFYNSTDGAFQMRLRSGSDQTIADPTRAGTVNDPDNERIFKVMFSEFSKEVLKRGPAFDLWSLSITLEEV